MKKIRNYEDILYRYYRSGASELSDVYGRYSEAKRRAWKSCEALCDEIGGYDLRVVSYNSNIFTAGFRYRNMRGDQCFCYITRSNVLYFVIDTGREDETEGRIDVTNDCRNLEMLRNLTANPATKRRIKALIMRLKQATTSNEVREAYLEYEHNLDEFSNPDPAVYCAKYERLYKKGLITYQEMNNGCDRIQEVYN